MPSMARRDPRKKAWDRGADWRAVGSCLTFTPRNSHCEISSSQFNELDMLDRTLTYHATQHGQTSQRHGHEDQCYDHRRALRVGFKDVMDFGELPIARHLNRRDRYIRVPGDGQRERNPIVGGRGAK